MTIQFYDVLHVFPNLMLMSFINIGLKWYIYVRVLEFILCISKRGG